MSTQTSHSGRVSWFRRLKVREKVALGSLAGMAVPALSIALAALLLDLRFGAGLFFGLALLIVASGAVVTYRLTRRITFPLRELAEAADHASAGELDLSLDLTPPVKCWEILDCRQVDCPAFGRTQPKCWFVDHTLCTGTSQARFPDKVQDCKHCPVYQAHAGDEVTLIADSFGHLTRRLISALDEVRETARFQENLIESSLDGIAAADADGAIVIINPALREILGYDPLSPGLSLKIFDLFPKNRRAEIIEALDSDDYGGPGNLHNYETVLLASDARRLPVRISAARFNPAEENAAGRSEDRAGLVVIVQDERERLEMQKRLVQTERLAAVGETIAGISHSIKNVLSMIKGGEYLVDGGLERGNEKRVAEGWAMVKKGDKYIADLVMKMLTLSRKRKPAYEELDAREIIESVIEVVSTDAEAKGVEVSMDVPAGVSGLVADASCLRECVMNLAGNAVDAAPEGEGRVKVGARGPLENDSGRREVRVFVEDNGPGVSEEMKEKILRPFFTTKKDKGTGLGLAVTHKIMSEHGGYVGIEDSKEGGARFVLHFPYIDHVPEEDEAVPALTNGAERRGMNAAAEPGSRGGLS